MEGEITPAVAALYIDFLWATLLGCLLGAATVISRYQDAPFRALGYPPAFLYIILCGAASAASLGLIQYAAGNPGTVPPQPGTRLLLVLTAGVGAVAILRTSLSFRYRDQDVSIGLNQLYEPLLAAADRAIDRQQALHRAETVVKLTKRVDFATARQELPLLCLALMQNVDPAAQTVLANQIKAIESFNIRDTTKTYALYLALFNLVGEAAVDAAVKLLLTQDSGSNPNPVPSDHREADAR